MPLEELGRYRIVDTLGENALGPRYLGSDPLLKREVMLQTTRLDPAALHGVGGETRLHEELKAAERLSHPSIATVYDCGIAGDIAYIASERLEGRDLRALIGTGKPTPPELAVDIIASVADGLAYAHRHGLNHLRITPGQITVLPGGGVKLSGFGLAALQLGNQLPDTIQGGAAYLAPEQFSGKKADGRTDVFALAIVFYQLLTGKLPFEGSNAAEVMYRIVRKPARWPSRMVRLEHRGFDVILAKALAKQPEHRYQSALEFATDLRRAAALTDATPLAWPTGGMASRRNGKHRPEGDDAADDLDDIERPAFLRPLPLAIAAGIVVIAGAALFLRGGGQSIAPQPAIKTTQTVPAPMAAVPASPPTVPEPPPQAVAVQIAAPAPEPTPAQPTTPVPPPKPATATLTLSVAPWGEVFVNDVSKGVSPPLTRMELPVGRIRLEIRNDGAPSLIKELQLDEGKTVRVKHKF